MPLAGGVPAPTITPLRLNVPGKPSNTIDTGTFIELGKGKRILAKILRGN